LFFFASLRLCETRFASIARRRRISVRRTMTRWAHLVAHR